jgi:hypothetical protein
LGFTSSTAEGVQDSTWFIATPPPQADGLVDPRFIEGVAREIAASMTTHDRGR